MQFENIVYLIFSNGQARVIELVSVRKSDKGVQDLMEANKTYL